MALCIKDALTALYATPELNKIAPNPRFPFSAQIELKDVIALAEIMYRQEMNRV